MPNLTDAFVDALHKLEAEREVQAIAAFFSDDAAISNPLVKHADGQKGAEAFWTTYREAFEEIASEFRHITDGNGVSFLEWTSKGTIDGQPFSYEGVSVLETDNDRITAFRTYFDPKQIRVVDR